MELAKLLGLSERQITNLMQQGTIPKPSKDGYDLAKCIQGYIGFLKSKRGSLTEERARLAKAQADMAELKVLTRKGQLVEAAGVQAEAFRIARIVRDAMINIPNRVAGPVAAETDQHRCRAILTKEIRQALENLSLMNRRQESKGSKEKPRNAKHKADDRTSKG